MSQQNNVKGDIAQQSFEDIPNDLPVVGEIPPNVQRSEGKFMNTDCWNKVFDWLSMKDVISFGRTCKVLHRVAGEYFQWKYQRITAMCVDKRIYINEECVDDYVQYLAKIFVYVDEYYNLDMTSTNFESFKGSFSFHIRLRTVDASIIKCIQETLSKVEKLSVIFLNFNGGVYENILKHCVNLKHLVIHDRCDLLQDCLPRKYPELQHLSLKNRMRPFKNNQLNRFFELNPNIRKLTMEAECLFEYHQVFIDSGIKLDDLIIWTDFNESKDHLNRVLNGLHQLGVYAKLHLRILSGPFQGLDALQGLTTVYLGGTIENFVVLSPLLELKELSIGWNLPGNKLNLTEIANLCINLEKITFFGGSIDDILPFIRHSRHLKTIDILHFLNENTIDISALNKERKQLSGARKVMILVCEDIYLATKWKTNVIDSDLIEMQRNESHGNKLVY